MVFEEILTPHYDSACRKLDRIKTGLLQSNPRVCRLYNILTNALKSDDLLKSLHVALGEIRNEIVESNFVLRCLCSVVVTVVGVLVKIRDIIL